MCGLLNLKGQHGVKGEAWSHVRVIAGEAVEKLRQGTEANVDEETVMRNAPLPVSCLLYGSPTMVSRTWWGSIRMLSILANFTTCVGPSFLPWEVA